MFTGSFYRLSDRGVSCSRDGLFVAGAPLLERDKGQAKAASWRPLAKQEVDELLTSRYGLPIDSTNLVGGLELVAKSLNRQDLPLAQIAALLLRLPEPPDPGSARTPDGLDALLKSLASVGLLKGDWDPAKHPRTGQPPNRGWFAPRPPGTKPPEPELPEPGLLGWVTVFGKFIARIGALVRGIVRIVALAGSWVADILFAASEALAPEPLEPNSRVKFEEDQANLDPPKSLEELQTLPTQNTLGYDHHHIVEQNPDNLAKDTAEAALQLLKFGVDAIDDPSNLVWIPRLRHWEITGYYNSKDDDDPQRRLHRRVVNELDFAGQREAGLAALREYGVLK